MAAKHWMQAAFANAHGQLHKTLGVPQGQKIPHDKLVRASHMKGKTGMRARAALNANP
jgi:hypothetical protein